MQKATLSIQKIEKRELFEQMIGVGFKEQLSSTLLPRGPWDVPVDELFLV